MRRIICSLGLCVIATSAGFAQTVTINTTTRFQTIDGFGTATSGSLPDQAWYQQLFLEDMDASIVRVGVTPKFKSSSNPATDYNGYNDTYGSPWYHFNPGLPGSSDVTQPVSQNVRKYTNPANYQNYSVVGPRQTVNYTVPIAVMGPDLQANYERYFTYGDGGYAAAAGRLAELALAQNGPQRFKLFGSIWSPPPWVKVPSGNTHGPPGFAGAPLQGAAFPFIWFDNFAGGVLDVSNTLHPQFDDSAFGGTGPTTALTQFTRGIASYVLGFQRHHGVQFYALSVQNEPHLEVFYDSCLYRDTASFITALKALRAEFDAHPELADIKLIGPEDTIGSESTFLWLWINNGDTRAKFLQFLRDIEADPVASAALAFYCVHGYDASGVTSAVAVPAVWDWSANGWGNAPNPAVPPNAIGYQDVGKKCWMTETSGENPNWLWPTTGFPNDGAFSIAVKLHQALTVGNVTAWLYWQMASSPGDTEALTDANQLATSPKFTAVRHFFKYIRPNAQRVEATSDLSTISASAYIHDDDRTLTVVLLNESSSSRNVTIQLPAGLGVPSLQRWLSSNGQLWQSGMLTVTNNTATLQLPGYSVATLVGNVADVSAPVLQNVRSRKLHG